MGGRQYVEPDNLLAAGSLVTTVAVIQSTLFDQILVPTLARKASKLAWAIVDGHVFFDTNKRTAAASGIILVILNGGHVNATNAEITELMRAAANGAMESSEFDEWWDEHVDPNP